MQAGAVPAAKCAEAGLKVIVGGDAAAFRPDSIWSRPSEACGPRPRVEISSAAADGLAVLIEGDSFSSGARGVSRRCRVRLMPSRRKMFQRAVRRHDLCRTLLRWMCVTRTRNGRRLATRRRRRRPGQTRIWGGVQLEGIIAGQIASSSSRGVARGGRRTRWRRTNGRGEALAVLSSRYAVNEAGRRARRNLNLPVSSCWWR